MNIVRRISLVTGGILAVAALSSANAAPLNLYLDWYPDLYSEGMTMAIASIPNSTSLQLTANGTPISLSLDSATDLTIDAPRTFSLSASVTPSGTFSSGSFTVNGMLGSYTGLLLSGNLTAIGFPTSADPEHPGALEFTYSVTGGHEQALFSGVGGIIFPNALYSFGGLFDEAVFQPSNVNYSDIGIVAIPEVTSLPVIFGAMTTLLVFGPKKKRS